MRLSILYLVIGLIITSCKSGVAKIDINDVEKHRAYQDTLFKNATNTKEIINTSRKIINEYQGISNSLKDNNSNYYYYLARAYSKFNDAPFFGYIYDTVNNKLTVPTYDIIHMTDSALLNAEKCLQLDPKNIRAMYLLARNIFFDECYLRKLSDKIPNIWSYQRDTASYRKRINSLINNTERFISIDTSTDSYLSRTICEVTLVMAAMSMKELRYNRKKTIEDNSNQVLLLSGNLYSYIKKFNNNLLVDLDREYFEKMMTDYYLMIGDIERKKEVENEIKVINNTSIQHKYACVKEEGMAGLFEIYTDEDYTFAITDMYGNTNSGRGRYSRKDNKLIIISEKGISPKCDGKISISKSGKVLINFGGVQYIEDDDGSYLNSNLNKSIGNQLEQMYQDYNQ